MTRATYDTLLRGTVAQLADDGTVVIQASAQAKPWLEGRWARAIQRALVSSGAPAQALRVEGPAGPLQP